MPRLDDLQTVELNGQMYGAYKEPAYRIPGIAEPVGLYELLTYVLGNLGGDGGSVGEDDVTEGQGAPSGDPENGPHIYIDEATGNVYTWNGVQWNLQLVLASNGLTKVGNDVELGGTLERATDVITNSNQLRFGQLTGNVLGYLTVRNNGELRLTTNDIAAALEGRLWMTPTQLFIEMKDGNDDGAQLFVLENKVDLTAALANVNVTRVTVDRNELYLLAPLLRIESPNLNSSSASNGHVLTLINAATGECDFLPATGGSIPADLPVYDNRGDAIAAGLVQNDWFRLSQTNTEGGVPGTAIQLL